VEHEVELFFGDAAERREVAGLVVTAAADAEAQLIDHRPRRRRRFGAADLADLVAGAEAVPVFAARFEAADLDVHAVAELGPGERHALLRHVLEPGIARDLP